MTIEEGKIMKVKTFEELRTLRRAIFLGMRVKWVSGEWKFRGGGNTVSSQFDSESTYNLANWEYDPELELIDVMPEIGSTWISKHDGTKAMVIKTSENKVLLGDVWEHVNRLNSDFRRM